jgi:hypothetical protein
LGAVAVAAWVTATRSLDAGGALAV